MSLVKNSILVLLLLAFSIKGYSGNIKGYVSDKQTGEPLIGVIVDLQGTTYGAVTGLDGSYLMRNIPPGTYDLEIRFSSYETYKQHIVIGDSTITISHQMGPLSSTLNEVAIIAKITNGSDEQARNIEKNSTNILNVMSARTIELLPDITVANVLQRVSGVQVIRDANGEARYPIIRGMPPRYNYTTVNEVKIPSPDDKARYVPLDIFPAEILDRINVIKTLTPDMEGDAIGGVTDLVMKKAPDNLLVYASAATGYNENLLDEHYNSFNKSDFQTQDPFQIHGPAYNASVSDFPLGSSVINHIQAPPNGLFSLSLGNRFFKHKLGVMLSGSYQNTYKESNDIFFKPASQPDVNNVPEFDDLDLRKYSTEETRTAIHTNIDYEINDKNSISLYGLFVQMNTLQERDIIDTSITGVNRPGPGLGQVDYKDRSAFIQQNIQNLSLKGNHIIANGLKIDWTGALSKATRDAPDLTEFTTENNFSKNPVSGVIQQQGLILDGVTKSWENTTDQDMQGFLNVTYTPSWLDNILELKGGGMYRTKDRDNYYNEYDINPVGVIGGVPYTSVQNINNSTLTLADPLGIADANSLSYNVRETIYAYYAQAKVNLMNDRLEILGGARLEHTHITDSEDLSPVLVAGVAGTFDYYDVLPSLNFKYKLTPKTNLRLAYFESISRPGFFELVNYELPASLAENFAEHGNDSLNHSVAQNLDLRYEWFPKGIDQILLGAFYKGIDNPIEYALTRPTGPSELEIQPQNLPHANNYGAEIVVTKYFHYFGVSGNYTYTHSLIKTQEIELVQTSAGETNQMVNITRPLQGQAANVGNLALIYKNPKTGLDAQLSAQYTGRHIYLVSDYVGLDYWQKSTTFLDFSCEKRIVKHLFAYAKVNNILNSPVIVEMDYSNAKFTNPATPSFYLPYQNLKDGKTLVESTNYGRNYLVGIRYKFN